MRVCAFAVAVVLALSCGGESKKLEGRRGDDAAGNDARGGANSGGSSRGGTSANSGTTGSAADGSGGQSATIIYLYDENNYRSTIELAIPTVETASGVNLDVCWTDVLSDLDCNPVEPEDEVDTVEMLRFQGLTEEQIEDTLASGELEQSYLDGYLQYGSNHESTCTELSSLNAFGTAVDVTEAYVESDDYKYLFSFTRGAALGTGTITTVFAKPTTSSMNTELDAEPGCGLRKLVAELATPVRVPFDGPWILDWTNVTVNGQRSLLDANNLDVATLWFVAGESPASFEDRVTDLDALATESYRLEITGGRNLRLSDMQSLVDGRAFASFRRDEAGLWLFGLACSLCLNAEVQQVLAVLEPTEAF